MDLQKVNVCWTKSPHVPEAMEFAGQVQIDAMDFGIEVMPQEHPLDYVYYNDGFVSSSGRMKPFMFAPVTLTGTRLSTTRNFSNLIPIFQMMTTFLMPMP